MWRWAPPDFQKLMVKYLGLLKKMGFVNHFLFRAEPVASLRGATLKRKSQNVRHSDIYRRILGVGGFDVV